MTRTNELFSSEVIGARNFEALDNIYTADATILHSLLASRKRALEMARGHLEPERLNPPTAKIHS